MADKKESILGKVAGGIAGTALGMIGQNSRATKQYNRQKELMGIQYNNQRELNKQGQELQLDTWKKTSYPAQMEMIKEAGLNPALLYGQGGAGGATTGSQGGGSAGGGSASAPMDIGQAAQIGLMTAQAEKLKAETDNIRENSEDTRQDIEEKSLFNRIRRFMEDDIYEAVRGRAKSDKAKGERDAYEWEAEKEANYIGKDGKFGNNSRAVTRAKEEADIITKSLEKLEAEIGYTKEKTNEVWHVIRQNWTKLGIQGSKVLIDAILSGKSMKQALELATRKKQSFTTKVDGNTGARTETSTTHY